MSNIIVCPLSKLAETYELHQPSHLVTIINEEAQVPVPKSILPTNYLRLSFNDITEQRDSLTIANKSHLLQLLEFAQKWDRQQPLLIHCYAGISRSTAAAFILSKLFNPERHEDDLAEELRKLSPSATPNMRLIKLADKYFNSEGRMISAIEKIGRGSDAFEGNIFIMPV